MRDCAVILAALIAAWILPALSLASDCIASIFSYFSRHFFFTFSCMPMASMTSAFLRFAWRKFWASWKCLFAAFTGSFVSFSEITAPTTWIIPARVANIPSAGWMRNITTR